MPATATATKPAATKTAATKTAATPRRTAATTTAASSKTAARPSSSASSSRPKTAAKRSTTAKPKTAPAVTEQPTEDDVKRVRSLLRSIRAEPRYPNEGSQSNDIVDTYLGPAFDALSLFSKTTFSQRFLHTCWSAHTWIYNMIGAPMTPRLFESANGPGCGKTTHMEIALDLGDSADEDFARMTPAFLIATLEEMQGDPKAIGLDETDKIFGFSGKKQGNPTLAAVINAGYATSGKVGVMRGGKRQKIKLFVPVVMAGNGFLPEDTGTRALINTLTKQKPDEVWLRELYQPYMQLIGQDMAAWLRLEESIEYMKTQPKAAAIDGDPRWQILMGPLANVAKLAGCHDQFLVAIKEVQEGITTAPKIEGPEGLILALRDVWDAEDPELSSAEVITMLRMHRSGQFKSLSLEGSNKRISERTVATALREYGMRATSHNGNHVYLRKDLMAIPLSVA
jgi:hypothetical protein